jgi:hypothetical protein
MLAGKTNNAFPFHQSKPGLHDIKLRHARESSILACGEIQRIEQRFFRAGDEIRRPQFTPVNALRHQCWLDLKKLVATI